MLEFETIMMEGHKMSKIGQFLIALDDMSPDTEFGLQVALHEFNRFSGYIKFEELALQDNPSKSKKRKLENDIREEEMVLQAIRSKVPDIDAIQKKYFEQIEQDRKKYSDT